MRKVPSYWWDYDRDGRVIVQSDSPGGECLATCASPEDAQRLIADYTAGRLTPPWAKPNTSRGKPPKRPSP